LAKKRPKKAQPKQEVESPPGGTNGWDFGIHVANLFYRLANARNFVGLAILAFIGWVYLITYRLEPSSLEKLILEFVRSDYYYLWPLTTALAISLWGNYIQWRSYERHIRTHVETRKELMHGLQTGTLKPLKNHNTSGKDVYAENHED
jgi:hypothetical protein